MPATNHTSKGFPQWEGTDRLAIRGDLNAAFAIMDDELVQKDGKIATLENEGSSLRATVADVNTRLGVAVSTVDDVSSSMGSIVNTQAAQDTRLDELNAALARPFNADTLGGIAPSGYERTLLDSGWIDITPLDITYTSTAKIRKIGRVVYLRGNITYKDGALEAGFTPGIIPEGYRPSLTSVIVCGGAISTDNDAMFKVSVSATSGIITIRANAGTNGSSSVYFDGISWLTS